MRLGDDARGVSVVVSHALTFAITSALLTVLLLSTGTFLHDQQKDVARQQLSDIGGQLTRHLVAVADADGPATRVNVSVEASFPSRVAGGVSYTVALLRDGDGDATLFLNTSDPRLRMTFTVPLDDTTAVRNSRANPGTLTIYNCWDSGDDRQELAIGGGHC